MEPRHEEDSGPRERTRKETEDADETEEPEEQILIGSSVSSVSSVSSDSYLLIGFRMNAGTSSSSSVMPSVEVFAGSRNDARDGCSARSSAGEA